MPLSANIKTLASNTVRYWWTAQTLAETIEKKLRRAGFLSRACTCFLSFCGKWSCQSGCQEKKQEGKLRETKVMWSNDRFGGCLAVVEHHGCELKHFSTQRSNFGRGFYLFFLEYQSESLLGFTCPKIFLSAPACLSNNMDCPCLFPFYTQTATSPHPKSKKKREGMSLVEEEEETEKGRTNITLLLFLLLLPKPKIPKFPPSCRLQQASPSLPKNPRREKYRRFVLLCGLDGKWLDLCFFFEKWKREPADLFRVKVVVGGEGGGGGGVLL